MKRLSVLFVALSIACVAPYASAGSLSIDPALKSGSLGESFALMVEGKGFTESIVGGGFNLHFNPAVLQLDSVAIDPIWEFAPKPGTVDNVTGTNTDASFNSFTTPRKGDFDIATLSFKAIGSGTSAITLTPSTTFVFSDVDANVVVPSFVDGSVQILAVPEPSIISMLLAGIAGLLLWRRKGRACT